MGKKSKRNRGSGGGNKQEQDVRLPPNQRPSSKEEEEETIENLKFQDPFVDEYIVEDAVVEVEVDGDDDDDDGAAEDDGDTKMKDTTTTTTTTTKNVATSSAGNANGDDEIIVQSWHPLMGENTEGVELEMDPTAYKMYHTLSPEWPSLSFDFCKDTLGDCRTRFPHSIQAVIGTQADGVPSNNNISVIKFSDLGKLPQENEDDDEFDLNDDDSEDDDSDDDDDDDLDLDPVLEHYTIPHYGGVNRIRTMPQNSNIVASWSDVGNVYLFDIKDLRSRFLDGKKPSSIHQNNKHHNNNKPIVTYSDHCIEGYAMDWSNVTTGNLATGDNNGNIHLWTPSSSGGSCGDYNIVKAYTQPNNNVSIEDIQWSPTESTVFAAAESLDNSQGQGQGGHVSIYDIRAPNKSMLRPNISKTADINVLSWNGLVSNLLATGDDDGTLAVWDLRHFQSSSSSKSDNNNKPLARFTCHKTPITSVEWHPTDESMLAVSDTVGAYVYDLSVEEDDNTASQQQQQGEITNLIADIPPQLLFCHSGSNDFKELHWHPQISSCIMTTAYSGFSIFIPSNL